MANCPECRGSKEIACIQCYGSGKHGSDPNKSCVYCHGKKKIRCPECGGTGKND
jgi:hypothetical protein